MAPVKKPSADEQKVSTAAPSNVSIECEQDQEILSEPGLTSINEKSKESLTEKPSSEEVKPVVNAASKVLSPTVSLDKAEAALGINQTFVLTAQFTGQPRPKVVWKFNSQPIVTSRRMMIEEKNGTTVSVLTLTNTLLEDSGTFTVTVQNESGEATAESTLTILAPPSAPRNCEVLEISQDSVTIAWDEPATDGGTSIKHYIIKKKSTGRTTWAKVSTSKERRVTIKDLQKSTSYDFRISAESDQGEGTPVDIEAVSTSAETKLVKEEQAGTIPTVTIRKIVQNVPAGQPVEVEVTFTGEPRPEIKIMCNEKAVVLSRRVKMDEARHDLKATFTITKTEISDSGDYSILVKNKNGSASTNFTVTVLTKAGPPQNFVVKDITETSATVTWQAPENDGGANIKHYILQKQVVGRSWQKVTTTTELTYTFIDLLDKTKYYFKIIPVTEQGDGETAEIGPVSVKGIILIIIHSKLSPKLSFYSSTQKR
jgi:titin